jgi:hypothetical protein
MARVSVTTKPEESKPAMKSSGLTALPAGPTTPAATKPSTTPVSASASTELNFDHLVKIVQAAYESGTTIEEAKAHAARFLEAQLNIAQELGTLDIDARMKKNGMKAARAQKYIELCGLTEKKPSDTFLEQQVTLDKVLVIPAVDAWERADARRENLMLYLGIFKDAHIYFRGIAKENFNG